MKKQEGFLVKMGMAWLALSLTALACGISPSAAKATATSAAKAPIATSAPTATVTEFPLATGTPQESVIPLATDTAAAVEATLEATEIPTEGSTVAGPNESWRIPPMTGAKLLVYDQTTAIDQKWITMLDKQARNLAMPKPYYFEVYDLPADATYIKVRDYYDQLITQNAMKKAFDDVGLNGIALATWVGTQVKNRKYLVQFVPATEKYVPWMFIMYSNPE